MSLRVRPVTFKEACDFVRALHRHNKPPQGHKFSIAVESNGQIVGVAMVGRPISRHFDNGLTADVNRTCTDGSKNANSMLYGAAWKAAKAMGYTRLITYTQADETGASLRAVGWIKVREFAAYNDWKRSDREQTPQQLEIPVHSSSTRVLWEITVNKVEDEK